LADGTRQWLDEQIRRAVAAYLRGELSPAEFQSRIDVATAARGSLRRSGAEPGTADPVGLPKWVRGKL
jgi:hypothetical protein